MKTPKTSKSRRRGPTHDSGYKLLYGHAAMVRDLLRGFAPGDWVQALDLETLERCSGSYVTDDLRDRADDIVWRLRWGPDWLYIYLLLEFQSTVDPWMAVRIQTYLGLLYQDLIRAGTLSAAGRLPPVLPVVLYNGVTPWRAAETLGAAHRAGAAAARVLSPATGLPAARRAAHRQRRLPARAQPQCGPVSARGQPRRGRGDGHRARLARLAQGAGTDRSAP
ncbi:Rpn family recombination-promoting nuclease/putative transposase [Thiocapsa sp.]|uniref:Rpn family recombination-promoting nuclease/putative transposase n=1 Tax=Thiocapsa sp. TaxID=2024551 RepID=UPI00262DC780|nr:Rpn family recombination-promoting nuclease/putative transposase [Thiocapsa sp.]